VKKVEKSLKKVLTKGREFDKIGKPLRERGGDRTLKIKQR
jgi:hypothetical protein